MDNSILICKSRRWKTTVEINRVFIARIKYDTHNKNTEQHMPFKVTRQEETAIIEQSEVGVY